MEPACRQVEDLAGAHGQVCDRHRLRIIDAGPALFGNAAGPQRRPRRGRAAPKGLGAAHHQHEVVGVISVRRRVIGRHAKPQSRRLQGNAWEPWVRHAQKRGHLRANLLRHWHHPPLVKREVVADVVKPSTDIMSGSGAFCPLQRGLRVCRSRKPCAQRHKRWRRWESSCGELEDCRLAGLPRLVQARKLQHIGIRVKAAVIWLMRARAAPLFEI